MKRPSFQFYPSDFIIDPGLSTLDYFHIGVYIKLLCFASQTGGELRYREGGEPLTITDLSVLLGLESNKCEKTIDTLLKHGCLKKRDDDGCLYNARMVRDCEEAQAYHENRKRASLIGVAARQKNKQPIVQPNVEPIVEPIVEPNNNQSFNQKETLSSSSSTSININSHTNARAREDEPLPKNMPDSETKAIGMCLGAGVPDDFIRQAFQDAYAVGFRDRGNPIINWKAYISAYWMRYQNAQKRKESQKQERQKPKEKPLGRLYDDTPIRELKL